MTDAKGSTKEMVRLARAGEYAPAFEAIADQPYIDVIAALEDLADEQPADRDFILELQKQLLDYYAGR